MGGEEIVWQIAYESTYCYDCLDFSCGCRRDDMLACQWRRWVKAFEEGLENDDGISD